MNLTASRKAMPLALLTSLPALALALLLLLPGVVVAQDEANKDETVAAAETTTAVPDWVAVSNEITEAVMLQQAKFAPETFSSLGISSVDADVMDLEPKIYERSQKSTREIIKDLEERKKTIEDPRVMQDVDILIQSLQEQQHTAELRRKYLLPYYDLPIIVFQSFRSLLDPRNDPERYPAALERLKKYTGKAKGTDPITELAIDRTWERFDDPDLVGPYKGQLETNLQRQAQLKAGLEQIFKDSGLEGYEKDLALLNKQLDQYADWLKKELLPRAREDHKLPREIYADNLKNFGVDITPEELIRQAQLGFAQIQFRMKAIARMVAEERGLENSDYRYVMDVLQKELVPEAELMDYYLARLADIETIIRDNDIVSLPDRPAKIRHATDAESAASPASFMSPPQLIGNTGQSGEFVLVSKNPSDTSGEAMSDFSSAPATWGLIAHEARPGHEMQFSAMLESGVSTARAVYAFNSANVEGWGLYSEAVMMQYFSPEAQLMGLRSLLMRAARAFLDPMINLGQISGEEAQAFMEGEVGISAPLAKSEVDRYSFRAPGQATSYYYGYMNLMSLRTEVELRMRERFNQREYHDFLLKQGLLPPDILRQAVLD
ncbi:MAG TPA: DUF885 domain-containing protein, partial [Xanthomonadales bacterium]|nr:DUF885 domain-containing protein [Xanthomonadales bacterium]